MVKDHTDGAFYTAEFIAHRVDCRNAWGVKQRKNEERKRRKWGKDFGKRCSKASGVCSHQHSEGADDGFLRGKSGKQSCGSAPVGKTKRSKNRRNKAANSGEHTLFTIRNHIKPHIKRLKKPDNDGRRKNYGKRAHQKIFCLIPNKEKNGFHAWHTVIRKFHNEWHRVTVKYRSLHQQSTQYPHQDTKQIQHNHDKRRMVRKERRRKDRVNRQFCAAAHKRRKQNRHFVVPLTGKRAGRHNGRNRAAETNQHRHKTAAGKAQLPQRLIHYKCNARHVAAVFQNGKEQEQNDNNRQKLQHASNTGKNAVNNQRFHDGVRAKRRQPGFCRLRYSVDSHCQQIAQPFAQDTERQPENQGHVQQENRNCRVFACENFVNLYTALMFF